MRHERIVSDPKILVGKPVIKGTRISVELVLDRLAFDLDVETLLLDYPRLTLDDVKACLDYASAVVAGEDRTVGTTATTATVPA
jgi:uncharacterized protein (DUF433 family)